MKKNRFCHVRHGIWMVRNNIKAYAFLSVTIIISFTMLLCFLIYTDSTIFNQYKEVISASPYISIVTSSIDDENEEKVFRLLTEKLEQIEDTYYYTYVKQGISLKHISESDLLTGMVHVVPTYCWGYYYSSTNRFLLEKEEKKLVLSKGEAVISEELNDLLKEVDDENGKRYINIPIEYADGTIKMHEFEVVGICNSNTSPVIVQGENGELIGCVDIFVSSDNFKSLNVQVLDKEMLIYSENMEKVNGWIEQLNLSNDTAYKAKNLAKEQICDSIFVKSIITIALLFLLGVNLYSSFCNALNDRKFEIGVRRAIGASSGDIVLQFFVEGLIVMIVDMMISIMCATVILCIYRIVRMCLYGEQWVISITTYSVSVFVCCSIFLSLIYSIIFALKSLDVEVVQYLKNE